MTERLLEEVCQLDHWNQAGKRVRANQGAPGTDRRTVGELPAWLGQHQQELLAALRDGSYEPQPLRRVQIPKQGGGRRQLGIPTVSARLVQQASLPVLEPWLDPTFSNSNYGYRPGRSAHDARAQARPYVAEGRTIVADIDLEKFFDRVNHDILMARLARRVADQRLLRIVRRFREAGLRQDGVCIERHEGTAQGGPLTPPPTRLTEVFCIWRNLAHFALARVAAEITCWSVEISPTCFSREKSSCRG